MKRQKVEKLKFAKLQGGKLLPLPNVEKRHQAYENQKVTVQLDRLITEFDEVGKGRKKIGRELR